VHLGHIEYGMMNIFICYAKGGNAFGTGVYKFKLRTLLYLSIHLHFLRAFFFFAISNMFQSNLNSLVLKECLQPYSQACWNRPLYLEVQDVLRFYVVLESKVSGNIYTCETTCKSTKLQVFDLESLSQPFTIPQYQYGQRNKADGNEPE
jgi:hypothetical protein